VHLLYVDESGDDGFPPKGEFFSNVSPSSVFIRTGLIIHDRQWQRVNQQINEFKAKLGIPKSIEIHATEIRRGKHKIYTTARKRKEVPNWYGETYPLLADRIALLEKICKFITELDEITLICVVIDKTQIKTELSNYRAIPKNNSWEFLIERYNLFLKNAQDKIGIILSDAVQDKIEKIHREFAKALFEQSAHVESQHFIESIMFEPSDSSNLLQLVDVASYAFFRHFNTQDSTLYDLLEGKLLTHKDGRGVDGAGLKIWPSSPS